MPKARVLALKPRRCRYCRAIFSPVRMCDSDQRFCCPAHRKLYWRYGGLPFDKLMERVRKEMRKMVREEIQEFLPQLAQSTAPPKNEQVA